MTLFHYYYNPHLVFYHSLLPIPLLFPFHQFLKCVCAEGDNPRYRSQVAHDDPSHDGKNIQKLYLHF